MIFCGTLGPQLTLQFQNPQDQNPESTESKVLGLVHMKDSGSTAWGELHDVWIALHQSDSMRQQGGTNGTTRQGRTGSGVIMWSRESDKLIATHVHGKSTTELGVTEFPVYGIRADRPDKLVRSRITVSGTTSTHTLGARGQVTPIKLAAPFHH